MSRVSMLAAFLLLALGLGAAPASAHKVNLFAYVENGAIKGEGYFAGGDKAKDSPVVLQDAQGRELASTRTDSQGNFTLPAPSSPPPWRLVMPAGQGHQASLNLRAEDVSPAAGQEASPQVGSAAAIEAAPAASGVGVGLNAAQLEELVGRAVERRLEPIKAQMARMQGENSFGLRDIMGGVGYILGLMGLAAYLKSRKG
jgi:nickel transport protein